MLKLFARFIKIANKRKILDYGNVSEVVMTA